MTMKLELPDEMEQSLRQRAAQSGEDIEAYLRKLVIEGLTTRTTNDNCVMEQQIPGFGTLFPAEEYLVDVSRAAIYDFRDDSGIDSPEAVARRRTEEITQARQHLDKLTAEQQVAGFVWADPHRRGHWPDEETVEGFVTAIREHRTASDLREFP